MATLAHACRDRDRLGRHGDLGQDRLVGEAGADDPAQLVVDQFNGYTVVDSVSHVNGRLTLGENIADLGGLHRFQRWDRPIITVSRC